MYVRSQRMFTGAGDEVQVQDEIGFEFQILKIGGTQAIGQH